jgi:hypothetical protein
VLPTGCVDTGCPDPAAPACDLDSLQCVGCTTNSDCHDPSKPFCYPYSDTFKDTCVECLSTNDCPKTASGSQMICHVNKCWDSGLDLDSGK